MCLAARHISAAVVALALLATSSGGAEARGPSEAEDPASSIPTAPRLSEPTEYFVHYLPWMRGPSSPHWCDTNYGNSYYGSVVGEWDCENVAVLQWQAALMKAVGISGVFFDYQMQDWNSCIDKMIGVLKGLGLKYAIMPDTAEGSGFLGAAIPWIKQKLQDPSYARFEGKPLLPVFDFPGDKAPNVAQLRAGLGEILIVSRLASRLAGVDAYYPWIDGPDPSALDGYYQSPPAGTRALVGGVWRGFEACYPARQPYLDHYANPQLLTATIGKAKQYSPPFVQIMTWDDYTEGTMIEPSFLIQRTISGCNTISHCANGADQGGTPDCTLPYCADGRPCKGSSPHCGACNGGGICSPYRDLITLYKELVDSSRDDHAIEALLDAIPKPPGSPFGASDEQLIVTV